MGSQMKSGNRETKDDGRRASVAKAGGTLGSHQAGQRESSSAGPINGKSEAPAESQDHLHQRIAERAYILYERSGFQEGKDLEHWLEAERQVRGVRSQAA